MNCLRQDPKFAASLLTNAFLTYEEAGQVGIIKSGHTYNSRKTTWTSRSNLQKRPYFLATENPTSRLVTEAHIFTLHHPARRHPVREARCIIYQSKHAEVHNETHKLTTRNDWKRWVGNRAAVISENCCNAGGLGT